MRSGRGARKKKIKPWMTNGIEQNFRKLLRQPKKDLIRSIFLDRRATAMTMSDSNNLK